MIRLWFWYVNPSYAIIYIIDAHQFSSLFTTGKRRISAHNRAIGRSGVPQEAQDDALSDGISADRQMPLLRPHRRPCCHGDSIPTRLCLKNDDFFSPRFKSPSEKAFKPDRCEGGWLWLKKTDNILLKGEAPQLILLYHLVHFICSLDNEPWGLLSVLLFLWWG